ncbi:MAG: hypothetical protein Q9224_003195 [Gallowayella concinna]
MTRAQQTISLALLVTSVLPSNFPISFPFPLYEAYVGINTSQVYLAFAFHLVPLNAKIQEDIIPVLPLWTLVSFGSYLLFKLGWGVITFNDVPQAYKELMADIEVARKDLKANGIDVD